MANIVILGGSFGGLTAVFQLRRRLGRSHKIILIANTEEFVFTPSLPWVAMGWKKAHNIVFSVRATLESMGVEFIKANVTNIDPSAQNVTAGDGTISYDYLCIATGADFDFESVPGLGPEKGYTHSIDNLKNALKAKQALQTFLEEPGPVVLGATQGVSCFGPVYELAFMMDYFLRKQGIRDKVPMYFLTSEPFIGHMGVGGLGRSRKALEDEFYERDINFLTNTIIERVTPDQVLLQDGRKIPYKYSMIFPALRGVSAVRNCPGLANEKGFIPVDQFQQHIKYNNIYAVGVTVAIAPKETTPVPTAVPKTGYMSEQMAKIAAYNISARIKGTELKSYNPEVICILDTGQKGFFMVAKPLLPPRNTRIVKEGRWAHWLKIALEKYHMWKLKHGMI